MSVVPLARPAEPQDSLYSLEAEAALLGAVLIDNSIVDDLGAPLQAEHFYVPLHQRIFDRTVTLIERQMTVTPVTLKPYLEGDEALAQLGGTAYLAQLTADGQGLLAPRELAQQIYDYAKRRRIHDLAKQIVEQTPQAWEQGDGAMLAAGLAEQLEGIDGHTAISAAPYRYQDPATIPTRQWAFGRWFLLGTAAAVLAPGGIGKTTFLAAVATSIATGREYLGKRVWGGRKRVWVWNLEDDMDELHRAFAAVQLHYGIPASELTGQLFLNSGMEGSSLCTAIGGPQGFRLLTPVYNRITREIRSKGIEILIIDPFVSSHEVEENDNPRIDKVVKAWARVAKDTGCCVILVHHASKAGAANVTIQSSRGAAALGDAVRSALTLNRMDESEAARLGISPDERRRYFRVADDKHNRAPAEAADWFALESVDLGNGNSEMPADSVGVAVPWKLPNPFDNVTTDDLRRIQARASERRWRESHQAGDWFGKLVAEELSIDLAQASGRATVKAIIKEWLTTGVFRIEEGKDDRHETRKFIVMGDPA